MNNYDDIINLKYTGSKRINKMSIENRASIFAPFNALCGFDDEIKERARLTDCKKVLSYDEKEKLDNKLNNLNKNNLVSVTYFQDDNKKEGGNYITIKTYIKKIDYINKLIILSNNQKINIDDIFDIKILS